MLLTINRGSTLQSSHHSAQSSFLTLVSSSPPQNRSQPAISYIVTATLTHPIVYSAYNKKKKKKVRTVKGAAFLPGLNKEENKRSVVIGTVITAIRFEQDHPNPTELNEKNNNECN